MTIKGTKTQFLSDINEIEELQDMIFSCYMVNKNHYVMQISIQCTLY